LSALLSSTSAITATTAATAALFTVRSRFNL
jgi:hypothetical protein